ncbi:MAG: Com family DNA-binding transcriptional regulator [Desulfovibrio sp.]|nr:Com family DNA-binding transcriptional regulator [Desulfovibrio sp.]
MKEFRCWRCNRLLAKEDIRGELSIKCPKCRAMNNLRTKSPSRESQEDRSEK